MSFDWAKYTGLTRRAVVKRPAEAMVHEAEQKAREEMTGRRAPTPKNIKDAIIERLRAYQGSGAGYLEKPTVTVDATGRIHAVVPMPSRTITSGGLVLPELAVGMRVRHLNPAFFASLFGAEGIVSEFFQAGHQQMFRVEFRERGSHWIEYDESNWLRTVFPCDASLLPPPAVGQRVAFAVDANHTFLGPVKSVSRGTINEWDDADGRGGGRVEGESNVSFWFNREHWLKRIWPLLRGEP